MGWKRHISHELRNDSLELRNVSLVLRNVSLELRNVSLELRNISSELDAHVLGTPTTQVPSLLPQQSLIDTRAPVRHTPKGYLYTLCIYTTDIPLLPRLSL
jgi:hypothetical protein